MRARISEIKRERETERKVTLVQFSTLTVSSFTFTNSLSFILQMLSDGFFVVFMVTFFVMRLGMYPYVCWSAHIEATRYFAKGLPEWTCVALLYILLALQVPHIRFTYRTLYQGGIETSYLHSIHQTVCFHISNLISNEYSPKLLKSNIALTAPTCLNTRGRRERVKQESSN